MRYTEWSDNERAETLLDILKITDPNSRDCNIKKCFRLVKCNNEEKKNAGYTAFANHIGADPKEIKQLVNAFIKEYETTNDRFYDEVADLIQFCRSSGVRPGLEPLKIKRFQTRFINDPDNPSVPVLTFQLCFY